MEQRFKIKSEQASLDAVLHYPDELLHENQANPVRLPIIVICHGFIGNKVGVDRLFVKAARHFCKHGYLVLRFDYPGCGESEGDYGSLTFMDLKEQTQAVLAYISKLDVVDANQIILLGHSFGGVLAIYCASELPQVKTIVLWSAVLHPRSDIVRIVGKRTLDIAEREGRADYKGYFLTRSFFDSLKELQPSKQLLHVRGDVLIVHGSSDDVIPVEYAFHYQKLFFLRVTGQADKEVIVDADHTYSSFDSSNQLIHATTQWLQQNRKRQEEWMDWMI